MKKLTFNEIYFGKTDAYNEYLTYGEDLFKENFYIDSTLSLNDILSGEIYYICGDKGTGKTMVLKYIESKINENPHNQFVEFVRFKKHIDETQRNQLKRSSKPNNSFEEIIEKDIPIDPSINCILAWQVYIIKVILTRLKSTEYGVFVRDSEEWNKLNNLIEAIYDDKDDLIKKIIPKVKKGNIEINVAKFGKLNLDLEWSDEGKRIIITPDFQQP